MKQMICCVAAIMLVMCIVLGSSKVRSQEKISGQYIVYSSNQEIERDEYQIVTGKKYADDVRAVISENERREYELVYKDDAFQYYREDLNGVTKYRATMESDILTFYDQLAMIGALPVEGKVTVFEPSVYSHYAQLVHGYNQREAGKQPKDVIVPSMQDFILVEVERHGSDVLKLSNKTIDAAHYRVVFGKKKEAVNLWFDGDKMIGMYFASKNKTVVDDGYEQLYNHLKQIINRAI